MKDQSILDQVKIASPCHARWEDMEGDDRARFCGQCRKHVYNFSAMTRTEVEALIREKDGRLCGRFYQRPDGRMLTADCPAGVQRRRSRLARLCGTVFAFLLFVLAGCARRQPQVMGMIALPPDQNDKTCPQPSKTNAPFILGEVYLPPQAPVSNAAPSASSDPKEK